MAMLSRIMRAAFFVAAILSALQIPNVGAVAAGGDPTPLLAKGKPVDWWFVFKFNTDAFPGCSSAAVRVCIFGGDVQKYENQGFGQQYVYASSDNPSLEQGSDCAGDSTSDPIGATFDQVYNGTFHYVIWNDQFYGDPEIQGCGDSCSAPWGHSKGMLAWGDSGAGFLLQVTTPSWPASGSKRHPRQTDGNTLGCVKDDNVKVSQHFFALRLTREDVVSVLSDVVLHDFSPGLRPTKKLPRCRWQL